MDTETEDECTVYITKVVKGNMILLHQEPLFEVSYVKSIEIIEE